MMYMYFKEGLLYSGRCIRIYLAFYGPEIIGGFGLEEKSQKTKTVYGPRRTNYMVVCRMCELL